MWFIEPSKTSFLPTRFVNRELIKKAKLINKIMLNFLPELSRTEMFQNIY